MLTILFWLLQGKDYFFILFQLSDELSIVPHQWLDHQFVLSFGLRGLRKIFLVFLAQFFPSFVDNVHGCSSHDFVIDLLQKVLFIMMRRRVSFLHFRFVCNTFANFVWFSWFQVEMMHFSIEYYEHLYFKYFLSHLSIISGSSSPVISFSTSSLASPSSPSSAVLHPPTSHCLAKHLSFIAQAMTSQKVSHSIPSQHCWKSNARCF